MPVTALGNPALAAFLRDLAQRQGKAGWYHDAFVPAGRKAFFIVGKEFFAMPIKIDGGLSAVNRLREEGIVTIGKDRAMTQDIRPLKILILNLMPLKKPTELQLLRLLGNSPIQIEIDFCRPVSRISTHTDNSYLDRVYLEWNDIKDRYYDGFIITGAPVEKIDFEDGEYWP